MKIAFIIGIPVALIALRLLKANLLVWTLAWWAGIYVVMRWGFTVPVPSSVIAIYMGIVTLSLAAFVTSSRERREEIARPLVRLMTDPGQKWALVLVVILLPALAAANVYLRMSVPIEAPLFARTVHPASPATITVHDREVHLNDEDNPFRALEKTNPEEFRRRVENGRATYYENCFFCHGDDMGGNGMYVHGLNPVPTNFVDPGTIPQLRETFLFWRVAKGAPGLPEEGGPWDSAMPAWEKFLTEEEMWEVVLFLYDFTGHRPRAKEELH